MAEYGLPCWWVPLYFFLARHNKQSNIILHCRFICFTPIGVLFFFNYMINSFDQLIRKSYINKEDSIFSNPTTGPSSILQMFVIGLLNMN